MMFRLDMTLMNYTIASNVRIQNRFHTVREIILNEGVKGCWKNPETTRQHTWGQEPEEIPSEKLFLCFEDK